LPGAPTRSEEWKAERRLALPLISYPEALPISKRRDEIAAAIADHQVVVVAGETGSGKTTQLPKICLELGRGIDAMIGHTQPRRIAARTVADRIAKELGVEVGGAVGYAVRFTDHVGDHTLVKLMTDGILLAELRSDAMLRAYDTIIVDEAHERSLNIDFILGRLVQILPKRPDLKVIVTSATIETERFSAHFGGAPVIEVTGRTYPVELRYRPLGPTVDGTIGEDEPTLSMAPVRDQVSAIVDAVRELRSEPPGDVLVFLSGEREIRDTADALREIGWADTEVLPLYARLSLAEQHRVFADHRGRRIVLATNVAETSLTVPGIRYVVDPGTARISRYSHRLKVQRLPIEAISQASANQRAGRCGRVADGICIRLYSADDLTARDEFTDPEILRTSLASVILQMTAIGLGEVADFPFLDPPDRRAIVDGKRLLHELGAIETDAVDVPPRLTKVGRRLARIPVDPRFARMVVEAERNGCLREVLVIAAGLSIQDPRERPTDHASAADQSHARFADPTSDFLALGNLWRYLRETQTASSSSQFRRTCKKEYLNFLRIREWQDVHSQLRRVVLDLGLTINAEAAAPELVHRSVLAGLLSHVGQKDRDRREYVGARNARFAIFPGSSVAKKPPDWVMAAELVETSRLWARTAARIEPEWIEPLAGHLVKRRFSEPHWSSRRGAAMAYERVTLYGLSIASNRLVGFAAVDPEHARQLFIRHALVEGDWSAAPAFVGANRELLTELEELEHRFRRSDLVADLDTLEQLYDSRVPPEIVSGRHFDSWWKQARQLEPRLLTFTVDDLLDDTAGDLDEDAFPAEWEQDGLWFGMSYAFEPGTADDGVAVHIPVTVLDQVRPVGFDWLVPGLHDELVHELIRSLPKPLRRGLVPIPESVAAFRAAVAPCSEPLLDALERELTARGGEPIGRDDWDLDRLPPHLRLRFLVVDDDDTVLGEGTDLSALQADLADRARVALSTLAGPGLEAIGDVRVGDRLTAWTITDLPELVERDHVGHRVKGYPALVDRAEHVTVEVFANRPDQYDAMWAGNRRLLRLTVPISFKAVQGSLSTDQRLSLGVNPYRRATDLFDDCVLTSLDLLLEELGGPTWLADEFQARRRRVEADLPATLAHTVRLVADVLAVDREVVLRLDGQVPALLQPTARAVRSQREALIYDGFVLRVGQARLGDLRRYLQAMVVRLDKAADAPGRDAHNETIVQQSLRSYDRLFEGPAVVSQPVVDIAWMIEELRVSLFAQALGTPAAISPKRVAAAIEAALSERRAARVHLNG